MCLSPGVGWGNGWPSAPRGRRAVGPPCRRSLRTQTRGAGVGVQGQALRAPGAPRLAGGSLLAAEGSQRLFFRNLGKSGLRVSCLGLGEYGGPWSRATKEAGAVGGLGRAEGGHPQQGGVGGAQEREGDSNTAFFLLRCGLHSQTTPFLRLHGTHSIRPRHTHCPARPRPQTSPRALRLVLQLAACSGHSLPPLFRGPKTGRREGQGPTHARDMLTVEQSAVTAGGCPLGPAGGGERPASCAGALTRACVSPSRNMGDLRRPDHRRGKTRLLRSRRPREGGPRGARGTHQ